MIRATWRGSVRLRILFGFIVAGVLPLLGALVVYDIVNSHALRDAEFKKIREMGSEAVRQITTIMNTASRELDTVTSNPTLLDPNQSTEAKINEMRRIVRAHQHYYELNLYDRFGFLLGSTAEEHDGQRERSRWFHQTMRTGEKSITYPRTIPGAEGLYVLVYCKLELGEESPLVVSARFQFDEISKVVSSMKLGANGELILLDDFGSVLASRDQNLITKRFDPHHDVKQWLKNSQGYYSFRGKRCLFTSHPMGPQQTKVEQGWTLLCFEPVEEVDAVLVTNRFSQLSAGAGALVIALLLGLLVCRNVSGPLDKATAAMENYARGFLDARMPLEGPREAQHLAAAFNQMVEDLNGSRETLDSKLASRSAQLERLEETLRKERESLAERVDLRTRELRAANKGLARSARMKDECLAGMSEEMHEPLRAMLELTESLQRGRYGEVVEAQKEPLRIIDERGHHLLDRINDVLDVAKIESGEMQLQTSAVDIAHLCQSCLQSLQPAAQKKGLELKANVDPKAQTLFADERRLKQILGNLLTNAIQRTKSGMVGIDIDAREEDNTMTFTVWDTGVGIPGDQIDRLFQPFVQLESSLDRDFEGTGFGLALVYHFTEIHGGCISADNRVNGGTRITVSLPWRKSEELDQPQAKGLLKTRHICLGKLLLADDNETERLHLAKSLNRSGYEVHLAHDGASAVELARLVQPDIVVMDVEMPGMDGLEATHHLRGEPAFRSLPIIGLTALNTPGDIQRIHDAGMSDCLLKPACASKLITIIDFHLDKVSHQFAEDSHSAA